MTAFKNFKKSIILFLFFSIFVSSIFAKTVQERFEGKDEIIYDVSFNGMYSGQIKWQYLGTEVVDGEVTDVLSVSSDTKILSFLDLTSKEKVFLSQSTHLPVKVKRDILMFGKKELITETYNQENGCVRITRANGKTEEEILYQDKPINNILALLYFFPEDVELKAEEWMTFNLPTQKVRIKMVKERSLEVGGESRDTYFLVGRGAKRFSLWLDKEDRLPLRIDFIVPLGKIIIRRHEVLQ